MNNEKTLYKTTRVIWYVFYVLEALLLFRFILKLLGANAAAGFTNFIYSLSYVPLAPFRLVFGTNSVGGSTLEWSTLLAMLVYWVVAWGIIKLVVMNRPLDEREAERGLEMQDNTQ
ncbi:hypothetical protein A2592_01010 [Candidatus Kaiserbacteria bacterium RIFOXYD1_FULL_42_15]|uniref:YggT family protein n=1 Tax=Candidatus Kaiserbacteria bacterium RIFOXYD1_FULL_42_15 TaxID=1798532 RepID=A0A1F6FPB2_9BACT|nr:MAG: hypothetical protein A2592_01010 [Candidatus Kaiserbacteria bacterium RIFOXYD1_FULL_42_15]